MIVVYRSVHCPLCKEHHDLWMQEPGTVLTFKPHEFLCPVTHHRTAWHPDVFAHVTSKQPDRGVELVPVHFAQSAGI